MYEWHLIVVNNSNLLKLICFSSSCTFGLDQQMGSNSHLCNLCCSRIPDQVQQEVCIYWGSYLDNALTNNHCLHYKALRSVFIMADLVERVTTFRITSARCTVIAMVAPFTLTKLPLTCRVSLSICTAGHTCQRHTDQQHVHHAHNAFHLQSHPLGLEIYRSH